MPYFGYDTCIACQRHWCQEDKRKGHEWWRVRDGEVARLALLPMHQPSVAKICCCSTNRPVHTEGRGGSADGRISERDSLFTKEAHWRLCPGANECRRLSIWQESTTVSTDLPGIDKRLHMEGKVKDICILLSISVFCLCCCVTYLHYIFNLKYTHGFAWVGSAGPEGAKSVPR